MGIGKKVVEGAGMKIKERDKISILFFVFLSWT